jgi:N-acetylmuramoyl-L-alanine amidase
MARGAQLSVESKFLQECLERGQILRCDDCQTDVRVRMDIARQTGARSSVLVPLRGRREQIGVLQAFSTSARAFGDQDVRCLDLFAELVLSALKPEDQDRRINWLSDIAGEVLETKSVAAPYLNISETRPVTQAPQLSAVLDSVSSTGSSRPGLGVVLVLVAVAALFSGATWWGMKRESSPVHERVVAAKSNDKNKSEVANPTRAGTAPSASPAPAANVQPATPGDSLTIDLALNDSQSAADAGAESGATQGTAQGKGVSRITGVRHWSSTAGSTVVIDMEDEVPYEVHRLASPSRIYFDLHGTSLLPELERKTLEVGDASLTRVRIGQPVAGITRVVLETKEGSNFAVSMESSPYRLVVELRGNGSGARGNRSEQASVGIAPHRATAPVMPSAVKAAPTTVTALRSPEQPLPAKTGKFRIVLDAGHGGWDLGTVGRRGLLEKDLVLDVTQRLGRLLQARLGSEVMFTRADDTYLPLDQRADMANQAQADLFVSVHANYSTSASARGIETYYTNMFAAPGSKDDEKRDDGTTSKFTPVALSAGGLHEKIEESRRLAASVQRSLFNTLGASSPDIRNRGIKGADFAVLTGTIMPSILTEISFVSSPADEHSLQSAAYRQQIAEALYQGIAHYQQSAPRAKIAQLQHDRAGN